MNTKISRAHNLSLESQEKPTIDDMENWFYYMGVLLDRIVPLKGMTNAERIEFFVRQNLQNYKNKSFEGK